MSLRSNWISFSWMRLQFQSLEKEVEHYFRELSQVHETMVRNPFYTELDVSNIPDNMKHEFLDIRNDSSRLSH